MLPMLPDIDNNGLAARLMAKLIPNPFSRKTVTDPVKGCGHYVDPKWPEFECLKTNAKREEYLKRHQVGLTPMPEKTPPLSKVYRDKKAGALELARHIRHGTRDGQTIFDFWRSIMDGTNPRFEKIELSDSLEASRLMAQYGFARMPQVDDKGNALTPQVNALFQILQVAQGAAPKLPQGQDDA